MIYSVNALRRAEKPRYRGGLQIKRCSTGCSAAARSETAKLTLKKKKKGELSVTKNAAVFNQNRKCDIVTPHSICCCGYKYQLAVIELMGIKASVRRLRSLSRPSVPEGFCLAVVSLRCHAGARVKFYINHAISRRRAHAGGRGE